MASQACSQLHQDKTDGLTHWFPVTLGVRQGWPHRLVPSYVRSKTEMASQAGS
jgi:hypothetical protein